MTYIPNISGIVSTNNSTSTPLGSSATFTGISDIVTQYATVTIMCFSDKNSDATGLQIQFSSDNTNWDIVRSVTYLANSKYVTDIIITAKYLRILYTNETSAQTSFRLQTLYHISRIPKDTPQSVTFTPAILDAFGRLRVSNPYTIIDISYTVDSNTYYETELTTGAGSIARNANAPIVNMTVTSGTDSAIKQSRQRGIYQPGKSLLIYVTGILNGNNNGTGVTSRLGYFDADNGEYFSHVGNGAAGTIYVNERSSCTGSIVTTSIAQTSWNIDKMNGTGPSGRTIDVSKTLIYVIDLEWLGVGIVRFGFVIAGEVFYCHFIYHSNFGTLPYMQVASLPIRGDIQTISGAGTLSRICGTVISEGGFSATGRIFTYSRPVINLITVGTTPIPIVSFQLKSTGVFPKVVAFPSGISILNTANSNVIWYLVMVRDTATASILTGSTFVSLNPNSALNYDISSTALAITFPDYTNNNITVIASGCLTGTSDAVNLSIPIQGNNPSVISTNLSGQSSTLIVICQASANTAMSATVTFNELY